ncbi:periplasmic nitrate reductase [Histoplasma ohiense]|nr:periplasmic nitrate reductase [Histoplasma ohiense (nom. inval.)]
MNGPTEATLLCNDIETPDKCAPERMRASRQWMWIGNNIHWGASWEQWSWVWNPSRSPLENQKRQRGQRMEQILLLLNGPQQLQFGNDWNRRRVCLEACGGDSRPS